MITNYLISAFRGLRNRTTFSLINIFGLAIGICAFLIILKYIDFETKYDAFHSNASTIYRINRTTIKSGERGVPRLWTTYGLGPSLKTDLPEVMRYIRVHAEECVLTYHPRTGMPKAFHEKKILAVDTSFFRSFTFESVKGNLIMSLDQPNAIVLTRSAAEKYFGGTDILGETMILTGGSMNGSYTVSAVMEDVPENSHFGFDFLLPISNMIQTRYKNDDGWGSNNFHTYVQLYNETSYQTTEQRLREVCRRRLNPKWKSYNIQMELHLQPLREIHLDPNVNGEVETTSYRTIYFFSMLALAILCIAWINYINLSTARTMERRKEVGIRKAIGAFRTELVAQFLVESFVINGIGIVFALMLAIILLPALGDIIGKQLNFDYTDLRLWMVLAALWLVGGIASGIYPGFVLSSFHTSRVFKGNAREGGYTLRQVLVVSQFCASLILITGTFVVHRQVTHLQDRDKGLSMDRVLVITGPGTIAWREAKQKLAILKDELEKLPDVKGVATSGAVPGGGHNWGADVRKTGTPLSEIKLAEVVWIDPDFIPLYNVAFAAGRNFNLNLRSDMNAVIVNETAVKAFDLGTVEQALGQQLVLEKDTSQIIGVLKDYNWNSLKTDFTPFIFKADTVVPLNISVQLGDHQLSSTVEAIGDIYKGLIPDEPYDYYFLDEAFNAQYKSDMQFGKIFGLFASLAIAISCLGLWGLAFFTTSQRLKEIAVRKVVGASVGSVVYMLTSQFIKLVLFAAVIGLPLSWYLMSTWLHGFAFRIGLQWHLFIVPVAILAALAVLTVSLQVMKGATTNPAKVLKSQ